MGLRGIIKDILFVYLGIMIIRTWLTNSKVTGGMVLATLVIFVVITWFMLERVGLMEKM